MKLAWRILFDTVDGYTRDASALLGAGLAYYGLISIAPLLLVVLAILSPLVGESVAREEVQAVLADWVGAPGANAIRAVLVSASEGQGGRIATLFGIAFTVFGSARLFSQFQRALDRVWGVEPTPKALHHQLVLWAIARVLSFVLVLGVGGIIIGSLTINALLAGFAEMAGDVLPLRTELLRLLESLATTLLLTLGFIFIYRVLPHVQVRWRDVVPGAFLTAVLLVIAKHLIGTYLGMFGARTALGAAGAIVFVVLWMSWSAQIVMLGAEFTRAWTVHVGNGMRPGVGYHRVDQVEVDREGHPVEDEEDDGPIPRWHDDAVATAEEE